MVEEACARFVGHLPQVPPAYSAKHVEGRRLYELARKGVEAPRPAVPVTIHSIELLSFGDGDATLLVRCSPGTYVRALARDLGLALGCGGHLRALRRTASGGFGLDAAVSGEALGPECRSRLLPLRDCLPAVPTVRLSGEGSEALRHGRDLSPAHVLEGFPVGVPPGRLRVLDPGGELVGLAVPRGFSAEGEGLPAEPRLHPDVVLVS
jgi:tRNA pseudouridine55 synthase